MGRAMRKVRSDDASQLKKAIGTYAVPSPDEKALSPPLGSNDCRGRMGFNHPELACLLCPVKHLSSLLADPVQQVQSIVILIVPLIYCVMTVL